MSVFIVPVAALILHLHPRPLNFYVACLLLTVLCRTFWLLGAVVVAHLGLGVALKLFFFNY